MPIPIAPRPTTPTRRIWFGILVLPRGAYTRFWEPTHLGHRQGLTIKLAHGSSAGKRYNPLPLLPKLLDTKSHHIAGLQKTRRFHAHADPRRSAGRNDIAGQKRHALAQIAHEL